MAHGGGRRGGPNRRGAKPFQNPFVEAGRWDRTIAERVMQAGYGNLSSLTEA